MAIVKKKIPASKFWTLGRSLQDTPEEQVRQRYLRELVNRYGYSKDQIDIELTTQLGKGKFVRADIAVYRNKQDKINRHSPIIIVECKAENITVDENDFWQGISYARQYNAPFLVMTNEKETRFYKVYQYPGHVEEITEIPKAEDPESRWQEILKKTKTFNRDEFANLLHECHNIIRNADKLDPTDVFDEISKVLFMKVHEERKAEDERRDSNFTRKWIEEREDWFKGLKASGVVDKDTTFIDSLFEETKKAFEQDQIFEAHEKIRLKNSTFKEVVKRLERYNLSRTGDDVKGIAFERFLGKTFRGELGQFFTPRQVVDFMISMIGSKEGKKVCDPASGSGGFLIRYFETVREEIEQDIQDKKDKIRKKIERDAKLSEKKRTTLIKQKFEQLNKELDLKNPTSRLYKLANECIFGTDANPRMAGTSKMNMIMHGDGHGGVYHHDGLINVDNIYEGLFDYVVTNPPFGAKVEKNLTVLPSDGDRKEDEWQIGKPLLELYDLGKNDSERVRNSQKTEVLFIERCIKLAKNNGKIAIVIPNSILSNTTDSYVREYIKIHTRILAVISVPFETFQSAGASVRASLVFLEKLPKNKKVKKNKYIFFANAGHVGFDSTGKTIPQNDLVNLLTAYKEKRISKVSRRPKHAWVKHSRLQDNLTPSFYLQRISGRKIIEEVPLRKFVNYREEKFSPQDYPDKLFKVLSIHFDGTASIREEKLGKNFKYTSQYYVHSGDIVLSRIDCPNGAVAVIPEELDNSVVSGEFYVLQPKNIDPTYLWYVLRTKTIRERMIASASGMTRRHRIKREELLSLAIPALDEKASRAFKTKVKNARRLQKSAQKAWQDAMESLENLFGKKIV